MAPAMDRSGFLDKAPFQKGPERHPLDWILNDFLNEHEPRSSKYLKIAYYVLKGESVY